MLKTPNLTRDPPYLRRFGKPWRQNWTENTQILKHGTFSFVCVRGKWNGDLKNPSTASPSNSLWATTAKSRHS
jgi:hypothetical protein